MKKNILFMGLLALGLGLTTASCSDDDDDTSQDFFADNTKAWGQCAEQVASYLKEDANNLYNKWSREYASTMKTAAKKDAYKSVNQIVDNCISMVNTISSKKIESTESQIAKTSVNDYKNNLKSVANTLLGVCLADNEGITDNTINKAATNSIIGRCQTSSERSLRDQAVYVWDALVAAYAVLNTTDINLSDWSNECAHLTHYLENLNDDISYGIEEEDCEEIVNQFVDNVVLPTYDSLVEYSESLNKIVRNLSTPTSATFANAATQWTLAHRYWELSEAFAFGPAATLKSAALMDTNPISQSGIKSLIKSQKWDQIKNTNNIRGLHALEYLIYEDGAPRKVN